MVNTRGILHTWQKGAIFRNKTTGVQNCTRGIHSTRSMSHILQTNRHNLTTQLTLFVHAIGIILIYSCGLYGSHTHIKNGVWWPEPKRGFAIETKL